MHRKTFLALVVLSTLAGCEGAKGPAEAPNPASDASLPKVQVPEIATFTTPEDLGLEIEAHPGGVRVTNVAKGSAAAKAGFGNGDVITSLKQGRLPINRDISDPSSLEELLKAYPPPDVIRFEVLEGGSKRQITIRRVRVR